MIRFSKEKQGLFTAIKIRMASIPKRVDFIIYGASGFTGQFVVKEVAVKAQKDKQLTWAVSGRSQSKLTSTLKSVEKQTGTRNLIN